MRLSACFWMRCFVVFSFFVPQKRKNIGLFSYCCKLQLLLLHILCTPSFFLLLLQVANFVIAHTSISFLLLSFLPILSFDIIIVLMKCSLPFYLCRYSWTKKERNDMDSQICHVSDSSFIGYACLYLLLLFFVLLFFSVILI